MSIDELKKEHTQVAIQLHMAVQPLRNRLSEFGFLIWWGGKDYKLSTDWVDETGTVFPVHDAHMGYLIAMSDDELRTYCLNWGKS